MTNLELSKRDEESLIAAARDFCESRLQALEKKIAELSLGEIEVGFGPRESRVQIENAKQKWRTRIEALKGPDAANVALQLHDSIGGFGPSETCQVA